MKRIHALIILISLIVTVIIIIGYVVGNIRHQLDDGISDEVNSVLSEDNIPNSVNRTQFALQLFASSNYSKVNRLKKKLRSHGQKSKITKLKRNGEIIYRLRVEELLPEDEAIALGEQLKNTFASIDGYWLEEQASYAQVDLEKNNVVEKIDKTVIEKKIEVSEDIPEKKIIDDKKNDDTPKMEKEEVKLKTKSVKPLDGGKLFEIQLLASSNYKGITAKKQYLEKKGYPAKILKVIINGKTIYRLRLQERFSEEKAITIGKKLVATTTFKDFWLQDLKGNEVYPKGEPKEQPTFSGDYDIQILANTNRSFVEKEKMKLEKYNYKAKIVSAVVKDKTYYRLRLAKSYDYTRANEVSSQLVKDVPYIKECWVVKSNLVIPNVKKQKTIQPKVDEEDNLVTSLDPRYAPRSILYTLTCSKNNVLIRIGPGTYYDKDNIGKLMKGIKLLVVEERNGWLRFRLKEDEYNWAGWVRKKDVQ